MKADKYIELIEKLNADLFERSPDSGHSFNYRTNGYVDIIMFDDIPIWDSENDDRSYDDNDIQMPLEDYIPAEFNRIISELHDLMIPIPLSKEEIEGTIEQYSRFLIHPHTIRAGTNGNAFEVVADGEDIVFEAKDSDDLSKFCAGYQIGNEADKMIKE